MSYSAKCKCGAIELVPLYGYPQFVLPKTSPEEGHEHSYKPYDPTQEKFEEINRRLIRIEQELGIGEDKL